MELRKKIKKDALASLRNSWGKALAILLFLCSIYLLFALLERMFGIFLSRHTWQDVPLWKNTFGTMGGLVPFPLLTTFFSIIRFVVTVPLSYGVLRWYLWQISGRSPDLSTIFDGFHGVRRFFSSLLLRLMIGLRMLGAGLLLYLPSMLIAVGIRWVRGYESVAAMTAQLVLIPLLIVVSGIATLFLILFSLRYFLAGYLFVSGCKGLHQCIRLSVQGMKGHIRETFFLYLSFLPWALLVPLLVPCLFILPYMQATFAIYAKYLMTKLEQNLKEQTI